LIGLERVRRRLTTAVFACLVLAGCPGTGGADGGTHDDAGPHEDAGDGVDGGADDDGGSPADAGEHDGGAPADGGPVDDGGSPTDGGNDDAGVVLYGFDIRTPTEVELPCDGGFCSGDTVPAPEVDYLCTLSYAPEAIEGYIYLTTRPEEYLDFLGFLYSVEAAYFSDGEVATPIAEAAYEWGGNHHNDYFDVTVEGVHFRYDHSSFGFGFRQCQPMDCLKILSDEGAVLVDGCEPDRTLPVACVQIPLEGPIPELVDTFMTCPGDPG